MAVMGEWAVLAVPAVLGGISLFVMILTRVESRLLD
jgi:hypothetical protein